MVFSGSDDRTIRVWDTLTYRCSRVLQGHDAKVRSLHYSAAEGKLYSGGHDGLILVWDIDNGEVVGRFEGQTGFITAIATSEDKVFSASSDKTVFVWDKVSGARVSILNHESWVGALALDGDTLYAGVGDATVRVWDVPSAGLVGSLTGHTKANAVSSLQIVEGKLYSGGWDGAVATWDLEEVQRRAELARSAAAVVKVAEKEVDKVPEEKGITIEEGSMFDDTDCNLLD